MKKEAVTIRPTASMKTARVGYQATGTGLEIGFIEWACVIITYRSIRQ